MLSYTVTENFCHKHDEVDLKLTRYRSLLEKLVYILIYIDIFYNRYIVLDETTVHS